MNTTTPSQGSDWRMLSAEEFAASPYAKLGGALAVIFWGATTMVVALLLMLAGILALGGFLPITMFSEIMFSASVPGPTMTIARLQAIQQALFALWAFVFVAMTLMRRSFTPIVASALMVIWAASWIAAEIATQYLSATGGFDLIGQVPLLGQILIQLIVAAAFCGYMSDGRRPNVYFRKRVHA
jgi:hypothetical protein